MDELEYNILGSKVKLKPSHDNIDQAKSAVDLVMREAQSVRQGNQKLGDLDVAVLTALNLAAKINGVEGEFQETVKYFEDELNGVLSTLDRPKL